MNVKLFAVCIIGWYFTSITLSVYNKWMFSPANGIGIQYPILLTTFHQLTLWFFSLIFILIRGRDKYNQVKRVDWKFYFKFMIPTAVATAGDIGLSNISFRFVPLTVYTIVKSSSIAFVLLFSCIFKLEKFRWKLGGIVMVMFLGVVLMVYKPTASENNQATDQGTLIFGTILVMGSSCLSGLRWVYTQLILKENAKNHQENVSEMQHPKTLNQEDWEVIDEDINTAHEVDIEKTTKKKPHPIYTIYQLAPIMALTLIITSLIVERPFPGFFKCNLFKEGLQKNGEISSRSVLKGIVLILIPGVCVFVLTLSEFGILQISKVLTLSIAGVIKEVLTILFGIWLLSERISGIYNILGMSVVLLDVCYYNYYRYQEKQAKDTYISLDDEDSAPLGGSSVNDSGSNSITQKNNDLFFDDDEIDNKNSPYPGAADITIQEYEMDVLNVSSGKQVLQK